MTEPEFMIGDRVEVRPRRPILTSRHDADDVALSSCPWVTGHVMRVQTGGRTVGQRRYVYTMLVVEDDSGRRVVCYGDEARHVGEEQQQGLLTRLVVRCFGWLEWVLDASGRR